MTLRTPDGRHWRPAHLRGTDYYDLCDATGRVITGLKRTRTRDKSGMTPAETLNPANNNPSPAG